MAQAPIYAPGGVPQVHQMPGIDAEAAGFGLARDAGQAAAAVTQDRQEERAATIQIDRLQREGIELRETAAASVDLAQLLGDTAIYAAKNQAESAGAGGAGHTDAVSKFFDDRAHGILDKITSPLVRARMLPQVANAGVSAKTSASVWETSAGTARAVQDVGLATNMVKNQAAMKIRAGAGLEAMDAGNAQNEHMWDSLAISDDLKTKGKREAYMQGAVSSATAMIDRDPQQAIKELDDKRFQILPEATLSALRDHAEAMQRRKESEARAQASAGKSQMLEALNTRWNVVKLGTGKPVDAYALADEYDALGETAKAVEVRAYAGGMQVTQQYRGFNLPQLNAIMTDLSAKQARDGLSANEALVFTGVKSLIDQQTALLKKPGGALIQNQIATNTKLDPINWNDPASIAKRVHAATAASEKYGLFRKEPLTEGELLGLQQAVDGGPQAQLSVLDQIAKLRDPEAIAGAARQITTDKKDAGFRIAAQYMNQPGGREVAQDILRGPDAIHGNPKVYIEARAKTAWTEYRSALIGLPDDAIADRLDATIALYGGRMVKGTAWDEKAWKDAEEAVLGSYVQNGVKYGGTAIMSSSKQRVVIPQGWTADGFFPRLKRATDDQWKKAAGGMTPKWPDGSKVSAAELGNLTPLWMGGTKYQLLTNNGKESRAIAAAQGGAYVFDAEKIPWGVP